MRIFIDIMGEDLKRIERLINEGKVTSINSFIRHAISNQLELEGIEVPDIFEENQHNTLIEYKKEEVVSTVDFKTENIHLTSQPLPEEQLKTPNISPKFPFWATQNRFFGTKIALRILQRELNDNNSDAINFSTYSLSVAQHTVKIRKILEKLDKKLGRKKGNKFSTSLPKEREASINRFISQFLGYISSDGIISGMLPEMGFVKIDVQNKDSRIGMTSYGEEFSNLPSPILDGYFIEGKMPSSVFAEDEVNFLTAHLKRGFMHHEADFIRLVLQSIAEDDNTPNSLNKRVGEYLAKTYSSIASSKREGRFSEKEIIGIRAGICSRLSELKLININIIENRTNYSLTERGNKFLESDK